MLHNNNGYKLGTNGGTLDMAQLAGVQKRFERSARLFGAVETVAGGTEFIEVPKNKSLIVAARTELGEEAFSEAWDKGKAIYLQRR